MGPGIMLESTPFLPMKNRFLLTPFLLALGLVLLASGFFLRPAATSAQSLTPTPDRLAEPTLPASPSQADLGAQVYWLSCLPCHGDRGQGLTDEFRAAYPPEEQYCWERGCHGEAPYESGFKLPKAIPAVVGEQALAKFKDAGQLHAYIRAAMPFWKPGSLTDEDSWKVTAYVLRANGLWNGAEELGPQNASQVKIQRGAEATATASPVPPSANEAVGLGGLAAGLVVVLITIFFYLRAKRSRN
jgi:cytochrome c